MYVVDYTDTLAYYIKFYYQLEPFIHLFIQLFILNGLNVKDLVFVLRVQHWVQIVTKKPTQMKYV